MTVLKARIDCLVQFILKAILLLLVSGFNQSALSQQTQQIHPLSTSNTRPIILVHGIPTSRNAQLIKASQWQFELDTELTNHFSYNYDSNETVRFDGETTRTVLSVKYGLDDKSELEVIVPYVAHDGGSLDQFIEDWHDIFGLPQNGRKNNARDQLHYFYEKNGVTKLDFRQSASGMGDVQLIFAQEKNPQTFLSLDHFAFKVSVKLPTGDADKLTGSEGMALSAWMTGDSAMKWFGKDWLSYFSFGGMWLEEGKVIADQQLPFALFGGIGTGIKLSDRIVLQTQLDTHTPLYKGSDMRELNSVAFLFSMGGNLKLTNGWNIDIAVVEDILPHSAPDVTFHVGVNGRW